MILNKEIVQEITYRVSQNMNNALDESDRLEFGTKEKSSLMSRFYELRTRDVLNEFTPLNWISTHSDNDVDVFTECGKHGIEVKVTGGVELRGNKVSKRSGEHLLVFHRSFFDYCACGAMLEESDWKPDASEKSCATSLSKDYLYFNVEGRVDYVGNLTVTFDKKDGKPRVKPLVRVETENVKQIKKS